MEEKMSLGLRRIELSEGDWMDAIECKEREITYFTDEEGFELGQRLECYGTGVCASRNTIGVVTEVREGRKYDRLRIWFP